MKEAFIRRARRGEPQAPPRWGDEERGAFDIRRLRADSLVLPRAERSVCRSSVGLPSVALLDHHIPRRGHAIRFLQVPVDLIAKPVVGSHLWSAERRESFTVKLTARQTCRTRGRCFAKRQDR